MGRQVLLPYAAGGGRGGGEDRGKERGPGEGGKLAKRGEKSRVGECSVGSGGLHIYCNIFFNQLKIVRKENITFYTKCP